MFGDKGLGERWNVLRALAKRWDVDRDDVQSVVEILAKVFRFHLRDENPVRRGDDPEVDLGDLCSADGSHFSILQNAEQFTLECQTHVADLVEK